MEISFPKLKDDFHESLIQFIWDQWVSIGVAGNPSSKPVPFVLDPEALLLATTEFCRDESRILSEVMDWLFLNGKLISLQRLKNHHYTSMIGNRPLLFEMAEVLTNSQHRNWKSVLSWEKEEGPRHKKSHYLSELEYRGMSRMPDAGSPQATIFKMRHLFGVNARAEVLTWLLTHESGYPAEIARDTAWFSKSVQSLLNDLENSRLVYSSSMKREKHFRIDHQKWREFLSSENDLQWLNQGPFYLGCLYATRILDKLTALKNPNERMQSVTIRKELGSMALSFELAKVAPPFPGHKHQSGEELINLFCKGLDEIRSKLERRD